MVFFLNITRRFGLLCFLFFIVFIGYSQEFPSNYTLKKVPINDTIQIDSTSINPIRFQLIEKSGTPIDSSYYQVDYQKGVVFIKDVSKIKSDSITVSYLKYPKFLTRDYFVLDTSIIVTNNSGIQKLYTLQERNTSNTFKPFDGLNTIGSISRGITIGNNQNAVVNNAQQNHK